MCLAARLPPCLSVCARLAGWLQDLDLDLPFNIEAGYERDGALMEQMRWAGQGGQGCRCAEGRGALPACARGAASEEQAAEP